MLENESLSITFLAEVCVSLYGTVPQNIRNCFRIVMTSVWRTFLQAIQKCVPKVNKFNCPRSIISGEERELQKRSIRNVKVIQPTWDSKSILLLPRIISWFSSATTVYSLQKHTFSIHHHTQVETARNNWFVDGAFKIIIISYNKILVCHITYYTRWTISIMSKASIYFAFVADFPLNLPKHNLHKRTPLNTVACVIVYLAGRHSSYFPA